MYGNYALFSDPVVRVGGEKNKLFNSNLRGIARYYGKHILETHDLFGVIDEIRVYEPDSDGNKRYSSY